MKPDDLKSAERILDFLRSTGIKIDLIHVFTSDRLAKGIVTGYRLQATTECQLYEMSGDSLYPLALELAEQLGVNWECP